MPMNETVKNEPRCERRTLFNLTKDQHEWIRKQAYKMNMTMSAVVRQVIRREMDSGDKAKPG